MSEQEELKKECLNQAIRVHSQASLETTSIGNKLSNSPEAILETAKKFEDYLKS